MFRLLFGWLVTTVAIFTVSRVVPGVHVDDFRTALAAAAVLGLLNFALKPILLFLTFPITVLSLGLFLLVINAAIFMLAGKIVDGLHVDSFWSALLAAAFVSAISWVAQLSFPRRSGRRTVVIRRKTVAAEPEAKVRDLN